MSDKCGICGGSIAEAFLTDRTQDFSYLLCSQDCFRAAVFYNLIEYGFESISHELSKIRGLLEKEGLKRTP